MPKYRTPGVFVEEISKYPPSVPEVESAIPAFIGYTEKASNNGQDLLNKPTRINSLIEFEEQFGGPHLETFTIAVSSNAIDILPDELSLIYKLHYCMRHYFDNGGGPCYIISSGPYSDTPTVLKTELEAGLNALEKEDEPTLILFPDATSLNSASDFYDLYQSALEQCKKLQDRFVICDVHQGDQDYTQPGTDVINRLADPGPPPVETGFREGIGNSNLKYGAAYYPWLESIYTYAYDASTLPVTGEGIPNGTTLRKEIPPEGDPDSEITSLFHSDTNLYNRILEEIEKHKVVLPPSAALAGIYATVDNTRGVWKAPANIKITSVTRPIISITNENRENLNVDIIAGKSVNAIRYFAGKGTIVWGARTLAGNDNEWRYISVRRFFNMVEESTKKATSQFVFEPNDANTWVLVKAMIVNFLTLQWRAGALAGAKADQAFYVKVGLGETMTALDILEGRMIVEIGMAAVRPAEFIILRFSHKMQES